MTFNQTTQPEETRSICVAGAEEGNAVCVAFEADSDRTKTGKMLSLKEYTEIMEGLRDKE